MTTPFPLADAEFQLTASLVSDIATMKGDEFKDDDGEVCMLVIGTAMATEQMRGVRRMLLRLAEEVSAVEWCELVTPELHNWVFATEITT